jgi:hypothetical protein
MTPQSKTVALVPKICLGHVGTHNEHTFVPSRPNQLRCRPNCGRADLRRGDRHKPGKNNRRGDRQNRRLQHALRPFIAIDGEGGGINDCGQQNYLLMCARGIDDASAAHVFKDNLPFSPEDCFEFILSLPKAAILVGFFFDYDVTQILRDLPEGRQRRLFIEHNSEEMPAYGRGISPYTYWEDYAIQYLPKQFFRVARTVRIRNTDGRKIIPGSSRTINEVGGFFQKPFVKVIEEWEVGDDETRRMIARNKADRSTFTAITPEIRRYCDEECRLLAETMTKLRTTCVEGTAAARKELAGITVSLEPRQWRGAGWLAASMHESGKTPKKKDLSRPLEVETMAIEAYYGGRFEISGTGIKLGPIYEYDINSAYPAGMAELPCPLHTRWHRVTKRPSDGSLYIADISFEHPPNALWAGFPVRTRDHHLHWPLKGSGVYWSVEIEAARKLGPRVQYKTIWAAEKCCDCEPFEWVPALYDYRKRIGKGTKGYPIQLGLNALYGKLAQRKGARTWQDPVAAGLITAITRAKLIEAVALDPEAVVMLATDGVYSTRPLKLDIGDALGSWELKERTGRMFIIQPGLYLFPDENNADAAFKTRGIPKSVVQQNKANFIETWRGWVNYVQASYSFIPPEAETAFTMLTGMPVFGINPKGTLRLDIFGAALDQAKVVPKVPVSLNQFVGLRLALQRNNLQSAGSWKSPCTGKECDHQSCGRKVISFDWSNKRARGVLRTSPIDEPLDTDCVSPTAVSEEEIAKLMTTGKFADEFEAPTNLEALWIEHRPIVGDVKLRSVSYDPSLERPQTEAEVQAMELEAMPDCVEIVEK